jgi:hypothetical protein
LPLAVAQPGRHGSFVKAPARFTGVGPLRLAEPAPDAPIPLFVDHDRKPETESTEERLERHPAKPSRPAQQLRRVSVGEASQRVDRFAGRAELLDALAQGGDYYWLAYDWDNLFLACHFCNSVNKRNIFPLRHESKRAKNHHADISTEDALIIRPDGPDDPRDDIGFHNEVPVGKTPAGLATIKVLGLDRHEHEQRLRLFQQIRDFRSIVLRYNGDTSRAAREIVADAHAALSAAVRTDAPFSAMAAAFLERNPLPVRVVTRRPAT